ncbi:uncharacterized protein A4U43_C03F19890 [Asparagus officinalis]|uniref:C2H2-type domain-containing protein n=1 Tax=Asparagus officinalis TaxID=4686 RepID=A0A5P1FBJ7_ASPOF|nr:uncharacterized protein A4U43_C03F19890 [Asparagus officinalis]
MEAASSRASPETSITENPPMAIVCEQCGMKFKRVQDLGKHRNKHKIDEEVEKLRKAQKAEQVGENVAVQISDEGVQAKVLEEAHQPKQAEAKKAVQASDEVVQEKVLEKASKTDQVEAKIPLHACNEEVEHDSSSQHEGPIGTCLFCMKFTHLQLAIDRSSIGRRISRAISKSMRFRKKQRQPAMAQCRAGCSSNVMGNTDEAFNLNTVANTESSSVNTKHDRSNNRIEEEGAGAKRARTQREQHQLSTAQDDADYSSNVASNVHAGFMPSTVAGTSADTGYGRNKHRINEEAIITKRTRMRREQRQLTATWSSTDVAFDPNKANIISNSTDQGYVRSKHGIDREYARTKKRVVADEFDDCNEELDLTLRL